MFDIDSKIKSIHSKKIEFLKKILKISEICLSKTENFRI